MFINLREDLRPSEFFTPTPFSAQNIEEVTYFDHHQHVLERRRPIPKLISPTHGRAIAGRAAAAAAAQPDAREIHGALRGVRLATRAPAPAEPSAATRLPAGRGDGERPADGAAPATAASTADDAADVPAANDASATVPAAAANATAAAAGRWWQERYPEVEAGFESRGRGHAEGAHPR